MLWSFKFSREICSSICFCDHQIIARDKMVFVFCVCGSQDFNVTSGSDWALLTSLKHYKCWDNTNWQTECSRFLFVFKCNTFSSFPFFFFAPFSCIRAIYLNGLSLHCGNSSSTCAMCETKRKVCFNTINPTIPHSNEREIVTICGRVSRRFA